MKFERLDNNIFVSHRKSLVDLLEEGDLALFFSNDEMPKSGDQNFPFHQQAQCPCLPVFPLPVHRGRGSRGLRAGGRRGR